MKIKNIFTATLITLATFTTLNAQASTKDPASAYQQPYTSQNQKASPVVTKEATVEIAGQPLAVVAKTQSGLVEVTVGDTKNLPANYYQFANVLVLAPAYLSANEINQALTAVNVEAKLNNAQYLAVQYNLAQNLDHEK
ncbi:hypothetical protein CKF59_06640 [Psittacicella gerlachiana]|uniref:Uncharacterized protein n=2 Tax=Psittacicella gerlachiana TaxID=2028574 RepID=A0A3A1Y461_9GAMM|nr:hypothetical protein CKF59_06640 [Psittacicella gerlachiana]